MAVIQISQIQVRRGYLQDVGQLNSGELGWALDKLRLFIGNGLLQEGAPYEGNTEILTANSDLLGLISNYIFRGTLGGYSIVSGVDPAHPAERRIQDKLDDFVNVRDFGAAGDGVTDDTPSIQRAIDEIYARRSILTPSIARRTIRFHPGAYSITEPLIIPQYCVFENIGKQSVFIIQRGLNAASIFKTTTSTGVSYNSPGNTLNILSELGYVEMNGITFQSDIGNIPLGIIDSAKVVKFHRCQFIGLDTQPEADGPGRCLTISSYVAETKSVYFTECDFTRNNIAIEIKNDIGTTDISFDKCTFGNIYQGIKITSNVDSLMSVRITNSLFENISQQAIFSDYSVNGVISSFNTFLNVGNMYLKEGIPVTPVIQFNGKHNYSIADIFSRTEEGNKYAATVTHNGEYSVSTNAVEEMRFGHTYQTIGKTVLMNNSSVNLIPLSEKFKSGKVDYTIERDDAQRSGTIRFSMNTVTKKSEYHDSYTETDTVGADVTVEFNSQLNQVKPYIICISDARGSSLAMTYDVKSLFN